MQVSSAKLSLIITPSLSQEMALHPFRTSEQDQGADLDSALPSSPKSAMCPAAKMNAKLDHISSLHGPLQAPSFLIPPCPPPNLHPPPPTANVAPAVSGGACKCPSQGCLPSAQNSPWLPLHSEEKSKLSPAHALLILSLPASPPISSLPAVQQQQPPGFSLSQFQPQGLCTSSALCLVHSFPDIIRTHSSPPSIPGSISPSWSFPRYLFKVS